MVVENVDVQMKDFVDIELLKMHVNIVYHVEKMIVKGEWNTLHLLIDPFLVFQTMVWPLEKVHICAMSSKEQIVENVDRMQ